MEPTIIKDNSFIGAKFLKKINLDIIPQLIFPKRDVLFLEFDKNQRQKDLLHAWMLSHMYGSTLTIVFEDIEGEKKVESLIKSIEETNVILQDDRMIPIHRIKSINCFFNNQYETK